MSTSSTLVVTGRVFSGSWGFVSDMVPVIFEVEGLCTSCRIMQMGRWRNIRRVYGPGV